MLKIIKKILLGIKRILTSKKRTQNRKNLRGLFKNPLFYFAFSCFFLFGFIYASLGTSANINGLNDSRFVFFNNFFDENINSNNLFSSQANAAQLEAPDLKIIQGNSIYGISTPRIVSGKVLGTVLGGSSKNKKEIVNYIVQSGDSISSIAEDHGVLTNTIRWANDLTSSAKLKVGQSLIILPVDGVLHIVKSGDTISGVSSKYKATSKELISFNDLASKDDIYIGDILVIPGGIMPKTSSFLINKNIALVNNFFIFPTKGRITQRLHFFNAVDVANKCGTPVYAAASGTVQRVRYGYNFGGGNHAKILHSNGVVTYYGHLMKIYIKPGQKVKVGDRIGLIGGGTGTIGDGRSTGCHLHFDVIGGKNPLSKYSVGKYIGY